VELCSECQILLEVGFIHFHTWFDDVDKDLLLYLLSCD